jgi:hypothetical protein
MIFNATQQVCYVGDLFLTELVTKVKTNNNSVEIHPLLSNNMHPVDGALVGAGLMWPIYLHMDSPVDGHTRFSTMTPLIPSTTLHQQWVHLFSLSCPWPNPSSYEKV